MTRIVFLDTETEREVEQMRQSHASDRLLCGLQHREACIAAMEARRARGVR